MLDFVLQIFEPLINLILSLVDFVQHIPNLLVSVISLLVNGLSFISGFYSNFVSSIEVIVAGYDVVYSVLAYMPAPIVTLVWFGVGVIAVRFVLDMF